MPDMKYLNLQLVAQDAVTDWFVKTGKIAKPQQLNVKRKFSDYGMDSVDMKNLSGHVTQFFESEVGVNLNLTMKWQQRQRPGTVAQFMSALSALPGQSSTIPSGPIKKRPPKTA